MITTKKGEWLEILVPGYWNGLDIEHVLKTIYQVPKTVLHQFRMNKSVKLNGSIVPWHTKLSANDKLQIHLFEEEEYGVTPEYTELHVLYEDDNLLIVNKPAGIDTHPTEPGQTGTLSNAVGGYLSLSGIQTKLRHIHRLDRDTTGAILFAKDRLSGAILDRMLEKREIKRTYLALVHGIMKQKKGRIEASIGRDRHHPTRRRVSPNGQHAVSHFKVIEQIRSKNMSVVELVLETGRTHQIRVHMSHIGHPLVGDTLYGGEAIVQRQALHAARIRFSHPITQAEITCHAPFIDEPPIFPLSVINLP